MAKDWDAAAIEQELMLEMTGVRTEGGEIIEKSSDELTKEIAKKSAPFAMKRLVHIACYSDNENTALKAADILINRVFGKVTDIPLMTGEEEDALRDMVDAAYSRVDE